MKPKSRSAAARIGFFEILRKKLLQNGNPYDIIPNVSDAGSLHIGMSPSGKAPDFDSGIRRFKSGHPSHMIR